MDFCSGTAGLENLESVLLDVSICSVLYYLHLPCCSVSLCEFTPDLQTLLFSPSDMTHVNMWCVRMEGFALSCRQMSHCSTHTLPTVHSTHMSTSKYWGGEAELLTIWCWITSDGFMAASTWSAQTCFIVKLWTGLRSFFMFGNQRLTDNKDASHVQCVINGQSMVRVIICKKIHDIRNTYAHKNHISC